ncbi:hypothetical protein PAERUG_P2_London_28_IMP_1_06_05_03939 [Pseudomonas aeruginosa]|nr:hypothetical protein PAERUG_P2_London_28_IMP_1_06_05_03939 [Pseudomonas aeruginosa]
MTARESACMKPHQTGTLALWLLMVLKDCDQPVSVGCGTLTWHWAERELSYWMVLRSTSMNGMPANITTTMATNTRFSMRAAESTPLLPSSAPSERAFNHSCTMIATNGSAKTPLETSTAQMPLWTIQDTRVR